MPLLSLKCHALGGVNGVHNYTCAFNTQYSLCFFLFSCGFLGLGKSFISCSTWNFSRRCVGCTSTGKWLPVSMCGEFQAAAREPHINNFLGAMHAQSCPWVWSVQQVAYLRISQSGNHCLIPNISAENDGLATLPSQETKETNPPEQDGSAPDSQRCLNPWCGTPVPRDIIQFSLEPCEKQDFASLRMAAGRSRKAFYLPKQHFPTPLAERWRQPNKRLKLILKLYFGWVQALKIWCDHVLLNAEFCSSPN